MTMTATTTTEHDSQNSGAAHIDNIDVHPDPPRWINRSRLWFPAQSTNGTPTTGTVPSSARPPRLLRLYLRPYQEVVAAVTKRVAHDAKALGSVPAVIVALPNSATPITDVMTAIENLLTAVVTIGASLAQVPSDLAALLSRLPRIAEMVPGRWG